MNIRLAAALFAVTLSVCPAKAQSLEAVLTAMDAGAGRFRSMAADIQDDNYTAIVNDHSVQKGVIHVRKTAGATLMWINFTGPAAKTIAIDAKTVKIFNPKANVVQVYDIGDKRSLVDQYLLLGFGVTSAELKKAYTISYVGSGTTAGQQTGEIELVPKSPEQLRQISKADLWISTALGIPVQQKFFTGAAGDYKLVTYSSIRLNPNLSEKELQLKLPKNVQTEHVGH